MLALALVLLLGLLPTSAATAPARRRHQIDNYSSSAESTFVLKQQRRLCGTAFVMTMCAEPARDGEAGSDKHRLEWQGSS